MALAHFWVPLGAQHSPGSQGIPRGSDTGWAAPNHRRRGLWALPAGLRALNVPKGGREGGTSDLGSIGALPAPGLDGRTPPSLLPHTAATSQLSCQARDPGLAQGWQVPFNPSHVSSHGGWWPDPLSGKVTPGAWRLTRDARHAPPSEAAGRGQHSGTKRKSLFTNCPLKFKLPTWASGLACQAARIGG